MDLFMGFSGKRGRTGEKGRMVPVVSGIEPHPFSEIGAYIRHGKNIKNAQSGRKEIKTFPDDERFNVNCWINGLKIKDSKARGLYQNAEQPVKENVCSATCGLKCFQ